MTKLNQILAIEKGVKATSTRLLTDLHRKSTTAALYEGRDRTYTTSIEEGEQFPAENQKLQLRSKNVIKDLQVSLGDLFDITFTKDKANLKAMSDVKVDGKVILANVPVTYLLFLEKQLADIHTFLSKLPVLDSSEDWALDSVQGVYKTSPVRSAKTKKVTKAVVLYEATEKHPAQVKEVSEDIVIGYWSTTRNSGALTQDQKDAMLDRLAKLTASVKFSREEANSCEADRHLVSDSLFSYLFSENA